MGKSVQLAISTSILFIGVFCLDEHVTLRLSDGKNTNDQLNQGNVEVFHNGEWKYICDDYWDIRDAKVVCRQIGFTKAVMATMGNYFKINHNGSYWLDNVQCWGSEPDITACYHIGLGKHNCEHGTELAGVVCSNVTENDIKKPIPSKASGPEGANVTVRLIGPEKYGFISQGYLEVFVDGVWGSVCSDKWTDIESLVACGNLGYSDIQKNKSKRTEDEEKDYELNFTHYWMTQVYCDGTESTLYECLHSGWKKHTCKSGGPVYLSCKRSSFINDKRFDLGGLANHNARLRAGSRHSEGRVEIRHEGRWGTICDDGWDIKDANIVCRQMGFGTAFEATHSAFFGQGVGKVWLDQVQCKGTEKSIHKCSHLGWSVGDCGHLEDAGVKCHFPYSPDVEEGKLRVIGGPHKRLGHLEVFSQGEWKGVCGIGFGPREAEVACRHAGLGYAVRGFSASTYGMNRKKALFNIKCSGDELRLQYCFHETEETGRCRYYDLAVVECSEFAPDIVMDYKEMKKTMKVQSVPLTTLVCALEEKCLSKSADYAFSYAALFERTLIRFTSRFWNRGTASFRPHVNKDDWIWHDCHSHYHSMERFADYDLVDSKGIKQSEGLKASFCLEDSLCDHGVKKFYNCTNKGDQGISVGCADNYKHNIDCQWIDVTDLPYDNYTLRVIVNPKRVALESDFTNNVVKCKIAFISQRKIEVEYCKIDECHQLTHGGTGDGACCKFPFIYKGKQYNSCTTKGTETFEKQFQWCGITTHYDKDKLWGLC